MRKNQIKTEAQTKTYLGNQLQILEIKTNPKKLALRSPQTKNK